MLRGDFEDPATGALRPSAMPIRMDRELVWARELRITVAVVIFQLYGTGQVEGFQMLRKRMRAHELLFVEGRDRCIVTLWDVQPEGVALAIARLGDIILSGGASPTIDVGAALFPTDSANGDRSLLLEVAASRFRPWQDYVDAVSGASDPET